MLGLGWLETSTFKGRGRRAHDDAERWLCVRARLSCACLCGEGVRRLSWVRTCLCGGASGWWTLGVPLLRLPLAAWKPDLLLRSLRRDQRSACPPVRRPGETSIREPTHPRLLPSRRLECGPPTDTRGARESLIGEENEDGAYEVPRRRRAWDVSKEVVVNIDFLGLRHAGSPYRRPGWTAPISPPVRTHLWNLPSKPLFDK